ncbi:MAG: tetratricopeptide repeat protein [Ardenticatenaceae bacterium]|nr:tetratricopeptide repeat protein [Ardenticatenaceae bacterium]HBY97938.1 hypothetical protein [Chloroflexota bacterium]
MPTLHIQLLGEFRIVYDDRPVTTVDSPRLQSFLAYLLLHRHAPQSRQHLAFLLWPNSTEAQARINLRSTLHRLRQVLPDADRFLHADVQTVQWRPDTAFTLDVLDFETAVAQADQAEGVGDASALSVALKQAVALYQGNLLPGCYGDWIVPERERLSQLFIGALERLILLLENRRDYLTAIGCAQRLLRHDPLHEATYRCVMRLHAALGDRAGVVRTYQTCVAVLQRELAVEPSPATHRAYEHLLKMEAPSPQLDDLPPRPTTNNLPLQLTTFIGREREMAEVKHLLATTRLVTLTGAGGCGKTRLALEVAAGVVEEFASGVWWVELAALADPALVPQAVASALGLHEQPGRARAEMLTSHLRSRHLLVVLDNCEHLIEACAHLASTLLGACPNLRILATSRQPLNIPGETTWLVPSLSVPESQRPMSARGDPVSALMWYEGARLFVERATAVLPTFTLTNRNAPAVAQVCRQLDGIPLAIELAAARVKVLPVEQIASRLDKCLLLLTDGRRMALPRHQTLRAAIDWSYNLLSEKEQTLFRRLSVFAGGFALEMTEAVCAGDAGHDAISSHEVLDLLSRLVDKSLVVMQERDGEARFRLLEIVRQYAVEKLVESGEAEGLRARHVDFFLRLAEEAEPELTGAEQVTWLDRLELEHDNFRAALGGCDVAAGLRLAAALSSFWFFRGYWNEGRRWLGRVLERSESMRVSARAKALIGAERLARLQGDYRLAHSLCQESLALYREVGDRRGIASALYHFGMNVRRDDPAQARALFEESLAIWQELGDMAGVSSALIDLGRLAWTEGDGTTARALFEQALTIRRKLGDPWGIAYGLYLFGYLTFDQGRYAEARSLFEEGLALRRTLGDRQGIADTLIYLGDIAWAQGDVLEAQSLYEETLALYEELGDQRGVATVLWALGDVARAQGHYGRAASELNQSLALYRQLGHGNVAYALLSLGHLATDQEDRRQARAFFEESLAHFRRRGNKEGMALCMAGLAGVTVSEQRSASAASAARAARLLAAARCLLKSIGVHLQPAYRADYDRTVAAVRAQLDAAALEASWAEGWAMTMEQAIEDALEQWNA